MAAPAGYNEVFPPGANPDNNVHAFDRNPYRGWVPYPGVDVYGSMEIQYVPLNEVVTQQDSSGWNWGALDTKLNDTASRGRQAVVRFYIDYPGQASGAPWFWSNFDRSSFTSYDNVRGDLVAFITEFGRRYDGNEKIAAVEQGLLGEWGEAHIGDPRFDVDHGQASYQAVLQAYSDSFKKTKTLVRYPNSMNVTYPVGFFDDQFTVDTTDATSSGWGMQSNLNATNQTGKYDNQMNGGEIDPTVSPRMDLWSQSIGVLHPSWLMSNSAADAAARIWQQRDLGYKLTVLSAQTPQSQTVAGQTQFYLWIELKNIGNAPYYYPHQVQWKLQKASDGSDARILADGSSNLSLLGVGAQHAYYAQHTLDRPLQSGQTYDIYVCGRNPLGNGRNIAFYNQGLGDDGWLWVANTTA
ncbi:MAG: hypothetical protein ACRC20_05985 [Segniliparus sp.]|uniref:hypothetical protein n=1 Tax=Segniliparus sp. TaxID=2804064 RepID=UPI003F31F46C